MVGLLRSKFVPALALALAVLATAGSKAAAESQILSDSTVIDRWQLPNGLAVVTRNVPGARVVAVTLGYRLGSDHDPAGREGLASLVAEVAFLSAAGEVPERTHRELESLRPMGWDIDVSRRFTRLSELARPDQLPGVIHQMTARLRSVTVTQRSLNDAFASVRGRLAQDYGERTDYALHYQVRTMAAHLPGPAIEQLASGKALQGVSVREAQRRIAEALVPANAVLCVAGRLGELDVHRLIESECAGIPAGRKLETPSRPALSPGRHSRPRPGITEPVGVLGIMAPALTDTLHPSFLLHTLVLASHCFEMWGRSSGPLSTRFQYSILEDPELVRFYPPVRAITDSLRLLESFSTAVSEVGHMIIGRESYDTARRGVGWLVGDALPPEILSRVISDPTALHTMCRNSAALEMTGGEAFWSGYRRRLMETIEPTFPHWGPYLLAASHRVELMFEPRK